MAGGTPSPSVVRFGSFELDLRAGELHKQGLRVKLQEQPFRVLTVLLRHPGEVVTREELRSQIWPADTFVDFDNSLNTSINKLREALGDSAENPRFIETLPRRGHRFIAPVTGDATVVRKAAIKSARKWGLAVPIVALVIGSLGGGLYWRFQKDRRLAEKDKIVLADFVNTTGDPVFDETLKQGLRVQLEQSPLLNILSDQKVAEELRLMGRSPDEPLTPDVAHDLCQRVGSKAVLKGSIASFGNHYVIGLNAFACQTGDSLANAQVEADSRERVLLALGDAATTVRKKLGESLASVEKFDVPLEQATTSSLEALRVYSIGLKTWWAKGEAAGLPFLKRAVDLDPTFAMAYARMGVMYGNLLQLELSSENTSKAYELRKNTSERERLFIEANYYAYVTGETEKATQVLEVRAQIYPRESGPHNNLANNYSYFGQHEKGLQHAILAMQLDPTVEDNYVTLANSYLCLNRLNDAQAVLKQAEDRKLEAESLVVERYQVAFLKGDEEEVDRLSAIATVKSGGEDLLLAQKEAVEGYHGRLRKSWDVVHSFGGQAKPAESIAILPLTQAGLGLLEAYFGEARLARADANASVPRTAPTDLPRWFAALALAIAHDTPGSTDLLKKLDNALPLDTSFQHYWKPTIRAAISMNEGNPREAIELLEVTRAYDLGTMASMDSSYLRGQAYLRLGDGSDAVTEFERIIDNPGIARNWPVGALAHLGLGRAYVLKRDTPRARSAYQDFFALWKDADPDVPILKQAKAEYAKRVLSSALSRRVKVPLALK